MKEEIKNNTIFWVDGIRCEILPYGNTRTDPIPENHYIIVADMEIDGEPYAWSESFIEDLPIDVAKVRFIINAVHSRMTVIRKRKKSHAICV